VLRRPRGLRNPGGFDFARLALERRYAATGHVREILRRGPGIDGVDARREAVSRRIAGGVDDPAAAALLRALAVGDQAAIPDALWDVFRATGTTHLVAISGFHIGLVGAFAGLLGGLLHRAVPRAGLRVPRRPLAAWCALAGAAGYSLLAGLSLPVQRTLAMLAAVLVAVALRRRLAAGGALGVAALAVLLLDPLAVLNAGFWLSFGGVFWLLFALDGRRRDAWWRVWSRAQWAAFVALLPLGVAWFQQASLVGPLANAVAIPWVSFVLVPLVLLAVALEPLPAAQDAVLAGAGWCARAYLALLDHFAGWPLAALDLPPPGTPALLLALAGAAIALLPAAVPGRALAPILWLPLLWPRVHAPPSATAEVTVLDVGQGLAVVVRTANHALLYDAGPARPDGFDAGEAVVVPALRALGVRRLHRIVVSHADGDHAGGLGAVRRRHPQADLLGGPDVDGARTCVAGSRWDWDGVAFEVLHPPAHFPALGNESSCVLRIAAGDRAILLPGDIGTVVEERLVAMDATLRADVLVLSHHGSRGGSGAPFLAAVAPALAVASAGQRNRFGHPAPEVVARVRDAGAGLLHTGPGGALRLRIDPGGVALVGMERRDAPRPWQEP
jgi:competence protein ComEC